MALSATCLRACRCLFFAFGVHITLRDGFKCISGIAGSHILEPITISSFLSIVCVHTMHGNSQGDAIKGKMTMALLYKALLLCNFVTGRKSTESPIIGMTTVS